MKVRLIICGVCRGEFDEGEWEADTRCPECESPKQKAGTRLATLSPPTSGEMRLREALERIANDPYQHGQRIQKMKAIARAALTKGAE